MIYSTTLPKPLLFLDFEASSLAVNSWPVEIGVSKVLEDGTIETHAKLIMPWLTWEDSGWAMESQAIHGISRKQLNKEGEPANKVAHWAFDILKDHVVISDAPFYEHRWLRRLLDVVQAPNIHIYDIDSAFSSTLGSKGLDVAFEYLSCTNVPHRAGPDSAIQATAWKYGKEADAGLRPVRPG